MRLGIFGGSFDPVHQGHLELATCCWRQAKLETVWFVPTACQPHKPRGPRATDADRLAMLKLAIADRPEFAVSTVELDRGGMSYTVDTLEAIHAGQPQAELFFLMGADSLKDLPHWREPARICELATPLVVHRAGAAEPNFDLLRPFVPEDRLAAICSHQVEMPAMPVSSSQIRKQIAEASDWQSMVPAKVAGFIQQQRLYVGAARSGTP